ncbi:ribonuclease HII [Bacteroidota bacterium]|nr:ribonuclease HII [Bacteroidota bacterium]
MLKKNYSGAYPEAGCDEAGRGCLAGPVVAAAVIFEKGYSNRQLNDSKAIRESERYRLREIIIRDALAYAVAFVSESDIDRINILNASIQAMHHALSQLMIKPAHIIVDGNRFKPFGTIPHNCIIKGDAKYLSISAASILAKTCRDDHMNKIHLLYPMYGWDKNKGYPTLEHRKTTLKEGLTEFHRKTFNVALNNQEQLSLFGGIDPFFSAKHKYRHKSPKSTDAKGNVC